MNRICLSLLIIAGLFVHAPAFAAEEDYFIEDYVFEWIVYDKAETRFSLVRNPETVVVRIAAGMFEDGELSPQDAVTLAELLKGTENAYKDMKSSKDDLKKDVAAGNVSVSFIWSTKDGFSAKIKTKGSFMSVSLKREAARNFAKIFPDAENMAEFLKKAVDF